MAKKSHNFVVLKGSIIHVGGAKGFTKKQAQKLKKKLGGGKVMTRRRALFFKGKS